MILAKRVRQTSGARSSAGGRAGRRARRRAAGAGRRNGAQGGGRETAERGASRPPPNAHASQKRARGWKGRLGTPCKGPLARRREGARSSSQFRASPHYFGARGRAPGDVPNPRPPPIVGPPAAGRPAPKRGRGSPPSPRPRARAHSPPRASAWWLTAAPPAPARHPPARPRNHVDGVGYALPARGLCAGLLRPPSRPSYRRGRQAHPRPGSTTARARRAGWMGSARRTALATEVERGWAAGHRGKERNHE